MAGSKRYRGKRWPLGRDDSELPDQIDFLDRSVTDEVYKEMKEKPGNSQEDEEEKRKIEEEGIDIANDHLSQADRPEAQILDKPNLTMETQQKNTFSPDQAQLGINQEGSSEYSIGRQDESALTLPRKTSQEELAKEEDDQTVSGEANTTPKFLKRTTQSFAEGQGRIEQAENISKEKEYGIEPLKEQKETAKHPAKESQESFKMQSESSLHKIKSPSFEKAAENPSVPTEVKNEPEEEEKNATSSLPQYVKVQRSLTWEYNAQAPKQLQKKECKTETQVEGNTASKHSSRSVDSFASNDRILVIQRKATRNTAEEGSKRTFRTLTLGADSEQKRSNFPLQKRHTFGTD